MWMPTASDEDGELATPMHPNLKVISVSVQEFNLCMSTPSGVSLCWKAGNTDRGQGPAD